jgi:hypothetical protein
MDIAHYSTICPIDFDFQNIRSKVYTQVPYSEHSLLNTANKKLVPIDFYALFVDDRGNLFLALNSIFKTYDFALTYQGRQRTINYVSYDQIKHLLDYGPNQSTGFFKFMDSKPAARYSEERCDAARNGPVVFIRDGQTPTGTAFNSLKPMSLDDLEVYLPLLSVDGVGHLIYLKYYNTPNSNLEEFPVNQNDLPTVARSIFPVLKLLTEWEDTLDSPWDSTEPVPLAIQEFLLKLEMPFSVREDIKVNHEPMHVYRYLRGDENARNQPPADEMSHLTDITRRWVLSKMFYDNVGHMYRSMFPNTRK